MLTYPNCKINLGLKVLDKRKDGYHNLESVFIPVPWCDALEIIEDKKKSSSKIKFTNSGLEIKGSPQENLCVKAYNLLETDYKLPPIKMHLHKLIPMGAGLGGGSSDGASTLLELNNLFQLKLTTSQLKKYALQLGSDCAFFIENKMAFVSGRGEKQKTIDLKLNGLHLVIVHPKIHIPTKDAYSNILKSEYKKPLLDLSDLPLKKWKEYINNDFENYAFTEYPVLEKIKTTLYKKGAIYSSMTGSGSAIYGFSEEKIKIPKSWANYNVFQTLL